MLAHSFQWLQDRALFSAIRGASYAYLAILAVHVASLVLFGGMVLATDLRLLGFGLRSYSVREVMDGLRAPKRWGFALAAASGILLFGVQAAQYANNAWFAGKIVLLVLLAVNYRVFRRGDCRYPALTAGLSLLLWTGVICAGRGPATIKDVMHSMIDPGGDYLFESIEKVGDEHGTHEKAPRSDADWEAIRQRLAVLEQVPELVADRRAARPRDRSRNPQSESQPEEVERAIDADRASLARRARRLHDAAAVAMKAVDARDSDGLFRALDGIDKACENCHLHYWYPNDKRAQQAAKEDGIAE